MITRPNINSISDSIIQDIETNLGISVSSVKTNLIKILANSFSGEVFDVYGNVLFLARQFFPFWSEGEFLDNWGSLYDVVRQLPTTAKGFITVTGSIGTTIPDGTLLSRVDGVEYETVSIATIDGTGSAIIEIESKSVGEIGNYPVNEILTFTSPITNIDPEATISTAISNGFEREGDQSYRDRIVNKIRIESKNGKAGDWIDWAKEVSGVKNVWEYRLITGAGSVGVGFTVTGNNQIPDAAKIAEVKSYLERKAPIDFKEIFVLAIVEYSVNITLSISPDSAENRQSVESAISDWLTTISPTTKDLVSKVRINQLNQIANSIAGVFANITVPASDITLPFNNIPVLGTVTWA